ncbi:MAG: CinA family nicotinamide mononucleotide deamidase-related protein [Planctomycetota bacterium]
MATEHRTAAVVAIGDELALGQSLDTNSQWLADRLTSIGVSVIEHATLDDDRVRLHEALERLASQADLLVCTGGLGPTADDLTRFALADAMGAELKEDAEALAVIRTWFEGRGRVMPDANRVQALRPSAARFLPNPNGTAPGLACQIARCDVYCLPGPPREMRTMFDASVCKGVRPPMGRVVRTRMLRTFGLGESAAAARMRDAPEGDLMRRDRSPLVGVTASLGILTVRLRDEDAPTVEASERRLDETEAAVRACLGNYVFARGDVSLAGSVIELLRGRGASVTTAESCTGGMIAAALTDEPGSSDVFSGGWIAYANDVKRRELGVDAALFKDTGGAEAPGAVSEEVARAMAVGALSRGGADHALSVTGIAGPGGGTDNRPVGTVWIAHADRAGRGGPRVNVREFLFRGGRGSVRAWAVCSALAMLHLGLRGAGTLPLLGERADASRS